MVVHRKQCVTFKKTWNKFSIFVRVRIYITTVRRHLCHCGGHVVCDITVVYCNIIELASLLLIMQFVRWLVKYGEWMLRMQAQTDWPALRYHLNVLQKVPQEGPRMGCYSESCKVMDFRTRLFDVKCGYYHVFSFLFGLQKFHVCSWFVTVVSCWLPDVTNLIDSTVPVLLPFAFFEVYILRTTSHCRLNSVTTVHYMIMLMVVMPLHVLYVTG
jgi:hypothetical protein